MKDLLYLKDEQIKEFIQLLYYAYRETFSDPKEILSKNGETEINLILNLENKKAKFSLQNNRKFNLTQLKALKAKEYVAKITV